MAAAAPRLDERVMPAGTGARFGLLVVLALVTSAKMVLEITFSVTGSRLAECELAAGIDAFRSNPDQSRLLARLTQASAYVHCEARVAPPPTAWLLVGWPVLVLVVAVLVFYADWWWKTRRSRVSPLRDFDDPASGVVISDEVARLKDQAGVRAEVTCVVNLTSEARSASVLGSTRRPVLCLDFGLVAQRLRNAADGVDDPDFRAVLLHEFAHIRYGDISAARGTMAVWRAFVLVALLPYLIVSVVLVAGGSVWPGLGGYVPVDLRDALVTFVLAALGYLARCDVLRNREIFADREAVRNGADKQCWPPRPTGGLSWPRRAARGFAGLWRNHPGPELRAVSLDDPRALFVVQAMPVFLAGVAAALIDADFQFVDVIYFLSDPWLGAQWQVQAEGALSAVLITLVVGVALWRLVAYDDHSASAVLGPRRGVTGLRSGLWLGAGLVVGDLSAGQGTIAQFLPARPEMLLLVLAAGVGFAVWTVQCAGVWLAGAPGRIPRRVMTVGLAGGFLLLAWWFTWWADAGSPYSTGISISPSGFLRFFQYFYGQPLVHPAILSVVSWFDLVLSQLALPPLDLLAVAAVWVIPLLAWTRRRHGSAAALPSLRGPLSWAAGGAVATWACVAAAQAYMHRTQPPQPPLHGLYELSYTWLLLGAQTGPALVVAVAVGLRRGRFRLLAALIGAEATVLVGFAGVLVLVSADGCIRPLNTLETSCSWRPGLIEWGYATSADVTALVAALVAFAVCVLALARPSARRNGGEPPATRPRSTMRSGRRKTLAVTGTAGAAAVGMALAGIVMKFPQQSHFPSPASQVTASVGFGMGFSSVTPAAPPDPGTAALEVKYWSEFGGAALLSRLQVDTARIASVLAADFARQHRYTIQGYQDIEPLCADIVTVSQQSNTYFLLPDAQARPWWSGFAQLAGTGGRACESAVALLTRDQFSATFWTTLNSGFQQIGKAYVNTGFIAARIEALEEAGGITDDAGGIAGPKLNLLPLSPGWSSTGNTSNPMDLADAVAKLYPGSETWLARHRFVSAARESWTDGIGTRVTVFINRFAAATDAAGLISSWDAYFSKESAPAPALTDPTDGGMGTTVPASKQTHYVTTEMAAQLGVYVIEVQVYAGTSNPALAKELLRDQYAFLKVNSA